MMQTIATSNYISVQGELVRRLADGMVIIRVGTRDYIGRPVSAVQKLVSSKRYAKPA